MAGEVELKNGGGVGFTYTLPYPWEPDALEVATQTIPGAMNKPLTLIDVGPVCLVVTRVEDMDKLVRVMVKARADLLDMIDVLAVEAEREGEREEVA